MPLVFPSPSPPSQRYQNWVADGSKWLAQANSVPHCGWFGLQGSSPSSIAQFIPYNGDQIKINGSLWTIGPSISTGVAGATVNGVTNVGLTNGTLYYAYLTTSLGGALANVPSIDFSTTGPVISTTPGNEGVHIKSGDDTRSLIGMVYPSGGYFYDQANNRLCRTWFNNRPNVLLATWSGSGVGGGRTGVTSVNGLGWAGEAMYAETVWTVSSPAEQVIYLYNVVNGADAAQLTPNTGAGTYRVFHVNTSNGVSGFFSVVAQIWAQSQVVGSSSAAIHGKLY